MRVPKRDDDEDGGLDSLLDTMTNVVGILVLVLIVTQLGVSEAITEITTNSTITEEDLEAAKQKLVSLADEKVQLTEQTASLASFDVDAERERLRRLKEQLETRKKLLADQSRQANEFSLKIENDRATAEKNKKEVEDTKKKREELQRTLTVSLEKQAELKAKLDRTPRRTAAPAKVVTIPNPRPAPPGAQQATFICANNLVYPMNVEGIRKEAELRAKDIIVRRKLNLDPAKGIDPEAFAKLYTKLNINDDFFDVECYIADNRWPRLKLTPKEKRGADEEEVRRPGSRIRKIMASLDPTKFYARFYVLPDSFDVYVSSRQALSDAGVLAGWDPQGDSWQYTTSVPGGIELGPPLPKPPAPTTPATPAKPANVID
ncbi:MAG: hypothetical protein HQ518_15500 [Rhodopirellula sp.]|nr:hypothetical protein [Rhodopirellula sp.]